MKPPSDGKLSELERALRSRVGFDLQSVGERGLFAAVCRRMQEQSMTDGDYYAARLLDNEVEFEEFVESLVVPETWFFRDRQPFRCLQGYAVRHWRPARPGDRFRVLSIPCSTGEEPYSIAMALLEAGMPPSQIRIDGADLSRRALARAEHAVYGKASFRGDESAFPGLCERFLNRCDECFSAGDDLRAAVRFFHANLVSPSLLAEHLPYHVIFCRNVLIYLSADARRIALANLHRLLVSEGLLYVGHVEARVVAEGAFRPFHREYPFAFTPMETTTVPSLAANGETTAVLSRKARPPSTRRKPNAPVTSWQSSGKPSVDVTSRSKRPGPANVVNSTDETNALRTISVDKLAAARVAADAGRLEEAIGLCREVLDAEPFNVDALCLIGLVQQTRGQTSEAEASFRRVLYNAPCHEEALVHMMLLARQRGDEKSAANFRRRVRQLQDEEVRR